MTEYSLYLESGPKMRKTMIHVLDLLGCVIRGPTTEDALATTPKGIHTYLSFLRTLGEPVDPQAPFTTRIAIHIMEGVWLGEGDPTPGFAPDFLPLSSDDLAIGIIRLSGLHMSLLELISGLSREQLLVAPLNGHRPLFNVLEHAISSEYTYLRMQVGPIKELSSALKAIKPGCVDLPGALEDVWQMIDNRLSTFNFEERTRLVQHGQITWSAHRTLRRLLEHGWEHREEIRERLANFQ